MPLRTGATALARGQARPRSSLTNVSSIHAFADYLKDFERRSGRFGLLGSFPRKEKGTDQMLRIFTASTLCSLTATSAFAGRSPISASDPGMAIVPTDALTTAARIAMSWSVRSHRGQ